MTTDNDVFDMNAAPMRIGAVRLKVRDLDAVTTFYRRVLGLQTIESGDARALLGVGKTPLLELHGNPSLAPLDRRQAGLFHTAFLLPSRADLGRWLGFAIENGIPLQGASDHIVSEALYLSDPEGNGIEIYADRAPSHWRNARGEIHMTTEPMDAQGALASAAGTQWAGFPEDGFIGHVHLQVGDLEKAKGFYMDVLGFDLASDYPGAAFLASGGYHHQLAGNVWNSRRAGKRPEGMAGLDTVEIVVGDAGVLAAIAARSESAGIASIRNADGLTLHDPWGTAIMLKN